MSPALPQDGQMTLGADIADAYEQEGRRFRLQLREALQSDGRAINDAADDLHLDGSNVSRSLSDNGSNPHPKLIVYALWRDPTHRLIRYLCALAGGEFKPRPPPDAGHWLPLIREDLERRGLWQLVADSVGYRSPPEDTP